MLPIVLERMKSLGLTIFESGDFNLNIYGIRNTSRETDDWDDALGIAYKENNQWIVRQWTATTDLGSRYLKRPINPDGGAILVANSQYRNAYTIAKHRGKYQALCQTSAKVRVYRDDNRDAYLDLDPNSIQEGMFGINIHRSHPTTTVSSVGSYSAGCQVFQSPDDFKTFMSICRKQVKERGWDTFTYTLLDQWW